MIDAPAASLEHPAVVTWCHLHREIHETAAPPSQTSITHRDIENFRVLVLLLRRHDHFRSQVIEVRIESLHLHIIHEAFVLTDNELPQRREAEVAAHILDLHRMESGLRAAGRRKPVRVKLPALETNRKNLHAPPQILPCPRLHLPAKFGRAKMIHRP